MVDIIAYTDGGCRGNPGLGSWAFTLIDKDTRHALEAAACERHTTNNRMELMAVLECLRAMKKPGTPIEIRSDSKYTIDACSKLDGRLET